MNTITTKPASRLSMYFRSRYLRWRLDNIERDAVVHEQNAKLARIEAESLRVQLALLWTN